MNGNDLSFWTHTGAAAGGAVLTFLAGLSALFVKMRFGLAAVRKKENEDDYEVRRKEKNDAIAQWQEFAQSQKEELRKCREEYQGRFESQEQRIEQLDRDHLDCLSQGRQRDTQIKTLEGQLAELIRAKEKTKRPRVPKHD